MLNWIWLGLVLIAVVTAAFNGTMEAVSKAALDSAKSAISLVIGLTGAMVLFLGLTRVASEGGLLRWIVAALRPILRRLFPQIPDDHPAMGAMIMNFAANMLGLGNAATPFGIKAMVELDKLNEHRGVATNAMALFLAINTSSIVLMPPTGTVAIRVATDSAAPFAIWIPTLFATLCSTVVAITSCLLLQRLPFFRPRPLAGATPQDANAEVDDVDAVLPGLDEEREPLDWPRRLLLLGVAVALAVALGQGLRGAEAGAWPFLRDEVATHWLLPLLLVGFLAIGVAGRVRVYDAMVEGGREGLDVAVRIAPYLVVILVAIGMFRASGALDAGLGWIRPIADAFGVPSEALPMALLRPLSGSGSFAVMSEILETHGPDSFVGQVTSTLMGSTETTFYVLAVYLGAVQVRDARHILLACLAGDFAGFVGAVAACHLFFG